MKTFKVAVAFCVALTASTVFAQTDESLRLHYDFASLQGTSAMLRGSARLTAEGDIPVLDLGMENGYLDMGESVGEVIGSLGDFTVSTYLCLFPHSTFTQNGNFAFTFSNSSDIGAEQNGCIFFSARDTRYAITRTNWTAEQGVSWGQSATLEKWVHIAYTQTGTKGRVYVDGKQVAAGDITIKPSDLGQTRFNYLGRSCYVGDAYLRGVRYCDFRIYDKSLTSLEVKALSAEKLSTLNNALIDRQLKEAADATVLPDLDALTHDLTLPASALGGVSITWATSDASLITAKGRVTRPAKGEPNGTAVLTATFKKSGKTLTREYPVTVLALFDTQASLAYDLANLILTGNINALYSDLILPYNTVEGSLITWKSSHPDNLSDNGKLNKLAEKGETKEVTMTAAAHKDGETATRDFSVTIGQDEGYSAYLFAYFTGNAPNEEQICFALSTDGYNFTPLNNGEPIVGSDTIALKHGVRDPHILRGEDGAFYMVVTDMRCWEGWDSNDGMVLMKSTDLVNWTHSAIDFPSTWPDRFDRDDLTQVWAPQTIYDPAEGKYMVYYSIGMKSQPHYVIYYSYANDDFTQLTEPKVLFDLGSNTIDADIV